MARPSITADEIRSRIPGLDAVEPPFPPTGQKLVFPCTISGTRYVLKVVECAKDEDAEDGTFARLQREVAVLGTCQCANLPKLGPIGLTCIDSGATFLAAFTEEFIDGETLEHLLTAGALPVPQTIRLGRDIATAVAALWEQRKIHRDIKPANVMQLHADASFVLLDPGIAFDLNDASLTGTGLIPHTPGYLAPELVSPFAKRDADVRSDLFLLGVVMYCAATGVHPFIQRPNQNREAVASNILNLQPLAPVALRAEIGQPLSEIIMRLLEKKKHLRFKGCDQFLDALNRLVEA